MGTEKADLKQVRYLLLKMIFAFKNDYLHSKMILFIQKWYFSLKKSYKTLYLLTNENENDAERRFNSTGTIDVEREGNLCFKIDYSFLDNISLDDPRL